VAIVLVSWPIQLIAAYIVESAIDRSWQPWNGGWAAAAADILLTALSIVVPWFVFYRKHFRFDRLTLTPDGVASQGSYWRWVDVDVFQLGHGQSRLSRWTGIQAWTTVRSGPQPKRAPVPAYVKGMSRAHVVALLNQYRTTALQPGSTVDHGVLIVP
jgi:hypothetical protein